MKRMIPYLSSLLVLFILTNQLMAQETCTETLAKADAMFKGGNVENVEQTLKKCLNDGFSKDEKRDAYRLIIKSKLYEEKIQEAEEYMVKFLELDPEYELNPTLDPEEFEGLYNSFQTAPLWSWSVFGGINFVYPNLLEEFGTYNTEEQDIDEFKTSGISFHAGGRYNRFIAPHIELNLSGIFEIDEFTYSTLGLNEYDSISQIETQTTISVPISFTYDFLDKGNLKPYGRLGLNASYLVSANANLARNYVDLSQNTDQDLTYNDLTELRKRLQFAVLAGLGGKLKIPRGYLFVEAWYRYGLNNQVITEDRYLSGTGNNNSDKLYRIRHVDSDFSINKLSFSIGYVHNVYNPRKKEEKNK